MPYQADGTLIAKLKYLIICKRVIYHAKAQRTPRKTVLF
jgi:hypothetical protein